MRMKLRAVVRSITPGTLSPSTGSRARFSGHSNCAIDASNTRMRAGTDGSCSNGPKLLLSRNGAVDHSPISDGGRV